MRRGWPGRDRYAFGGGNPTSFAEYDGPFGIAIVAVAAVFVAAAALITDEVSAEQSGRESLLDRMTDGLTSTAEGIRDSIERATEDDPEPKPDNKPRKDSEPQAEPRPLPTPSPAPSPMNRSRQDCTSGNWSGSAIQYDPLVDGKAQGAHACLTKPLGAGITGTRLPISGYQEARDQGYNVSRCHVIGKDLGGDGAREDNLFTCAQNPTNSANMYHQFEKKVAGLVDRLGVCLPRAHGSRF